MISGAVLKRALSSVALLKYFPANNSEALAAVGEMFRELYSTDAEVEKVIPAMLRDPAVSEWPGAGEFFEWLKRAVYSCGMCKVDGRWVPSPENGPEFDLIAPDGSRHWIAGTYYVYPQRPRRSAETVEGLAA